MRTLPGKPVAEVTVMLLPLVGAMRTGVQVRRRVGVPVLLPLVGAMRTLIHPIREALDV